MIRLLLPVPTPAPERQEVSGERLHYLSRVLRVRPGDRLEVFDGRGRRFPAEVESIDARGAWLRLGEEQRETALPGPLLIQGLPKGEKLEWILQKGTELGAGAFWPVFTERCIAQLDPARAEQRVRRWARIVEEAARQCGRSEVPEVAPPRKLLAAVDALPQGTSVLVLDEEERGVRLAEAMGQLGSPYALVVGPEGGLARGEVEALVGRGARPVSLGKRVLRTETAALAGLALLMHLTGELG